MVDLRLPLALPSAANAREHWAARHRRVAAVRGIVAAALRARVRGMAFPVRVILTRVAPRALDPFDNLPASLKPVADGVADALGIDDRSPLLTFEARQRRGAAREYAVEINIRSEGGP